MEKSAETIGHRIEHQEMSMSIKVLIPVTAVVMAGGAVLAIGATALPVAASAVSPSTHAAPTATVREDLVGTTIASGQRVLNAVQLAESTFIIGSRGDDVRYAASIAGDTFARNWDAMSRGVALKPDEVESSGTGNSAGHIANLAGFVGSDVAAVTVHPVAGGDVHASVDNGTVLAVWDGHDFDSRETLGTTLTIELEDGTSRTVAWTSIE